MCGEWWQPCGRLDDLCGTVYRLLKLVERIYPFECFLSSVLLEIVADHRMCELEAVCKKISLHYVMMQIKETRNITHVSLPKETLK